MFLSAVLLTDVDPSLLYALHQHTYLCSGGAFNPAVALGLSLSKGLSNIGYSGFVALANLVGGAAAAAVFFLVGKLNNCTVPVVFPR